MKGLRRIDWQHHNAQRRRESFVGDVIDYVIEKASDIIDTVANFLLSIICETLIEQHGHSPTL